jgi:hypothetical protein
VIDWFQRQDGLTQVAIVSIILLLAATQVAKVVK